MRKIEGRVTTQCRFNATLYSKLKIIAEREHRYVNSQLEFFIDKAIKEYESKNGPIELTEDNE